MDGNAKTLGWLQDRYSFAGLTMTRNDLIQDAANRLSYNGPNPLGVTTQNNNFGKRIGFINDNNNQITDERDPFKQLYELYSQRQNQLRNPNDNREPYMTSNGRIIMAQSAMIDRYMKENFPRRDNDSDNDEEYMDTTTTLHPATRKNSQSSGKSGKDGVLHQCIIS